MKKRAKLELEYHEGLSSNQCSVILAELGMKDSIEEFHAWLYGQTLPMISRYDAKGELRTIAGVYEYDLFRFVAWKKNGTVLIFD